MRGITRPGRLRRLWLAAALSIWLAAAGFLSAQATAPQLLERVAAIAAGEDGSMRRAAITRQLDAIGLTYQLEEFTRPPAVGTNIIADIPAATGATKLLLLGAHYDRVNVGTGAIDNGAGCATLLELLAVLKTKPLQNYAIRAVFFDVEERGLLGSRDYFEAPRADKVPALAVNVDIFGYGDTIFAVTSHPEGSLASALQTATQQSALPLRLISDRNRYPASDHRSMMTAGIETLGLALIDGSEIDSILQPSGARPPILSIIHSASDTIDRVRPADMQKGVAVVEQMLRILDTSP